MADIPEPMQTPPTSGPAGKISGLFSRFNKPLWLTLIILAALTLVSVVYVLFFRGIGMKQSYKGDLKVSVQAPDSSPTGSELTYGVDIENLTNVKMTNVTLEVVYPSGFTFVNSTPDPQESSARTFVFPDLASQGKQHLAIVGRLDGSVQEIKTLTVKLHYIPVNFRSSFETDASATTVIAAPALAMHLAAPAQFITGELINYQLQVTNVATHPFSGVGLKLSYPEKFQFNKADNLQPNQTSDRGSEWDISNIDIGQSLNFSVLGRLSQEPGKEAAVQAEIFLKSPDGNVVSAGQISAVTQMLPSPLILTQRLIKPPDVFLQGQDLNYEVDYQNVSQVGLTNVVVQLDFDTQVFDYTKLRIEKGQLKNNTIVWTPAQLPELLAMQPNQQGQFQFSIALKANLAGSSVKNPTLRTRLQYTSQELSEPIFSNTLEYKIQSEMQVAASAKLISGANPPVVGLPTTYQIDLTVTNGVNDVSQAILLATIPRTEAQFSVAAVNPPEEQANVQFVPVSGSLRWQLGEIFALTGSFHDPRKLSFPLTVTPTASDNLNRLTLLQGIQASGTDNFTSNDLKSNQIDSLVTSNQ
jgi:uncharacterized repeat protein (TIGR01451 family)